MKLLIGMTTDELIGFAQHSLVLPVYASASELIEELCARLKEAAILKDKP